MADFSTDWLDSLASDAHPQAEWKRALAAAEAIPAFARPRESELAILARASRNPSQLHLLLTAFARHGASLPANAPANQHPFALLCEYADDSAYDLRQWMDALAVFDQWLQEQNRDEQPLAMLLAYLSCCAEGQANSSLPLHLSHVLADMLEQYGYDGGADA